MIIGVGTDIVDMSRIQKIWDRHGDRFLDRIFTPYEQTYCLAKNKLAANSFAKIFAAKESMLKAIGNTSNIDWHDMEVRHELTGRPFLKVSGFARQNLHQAVEELLGKECQNDYANVKINLSLSDEPPYGVAFVVVSCG